MIYEFAQERVFKRLNEENALMPLLVLRLKRSLVRVCSDNQCGCDRLV